MTAHSRSSSCAPPPAAALVRSRAARAPNYSGLPRSPCSETCSASSTFRPTRGTRPARRRRAVTGSAAFPPPSSFRRRRRRTRSRTLRPCSWLAAALASLRILWPQRKPQWRWRRRSSARQCCRSWRRATRPCSTCRTDGSRWTSCRLRPSGRKSPGIRVSLELFLVLCVGAIFFIRTRACCWCRPVRSADPLAEGGKRLNAHVLAGHDRSWSLYVFSIQEIGVKAIRIYSEVNKTTRPPTLDRLWMADQESLDNWISDTRIQHLKHNGLLLENQRSRSTQRKAKTPP
ncbi:hypothetical protein T492DRAFT_96695 [Pavlovales sp. CCMP2436]|nr:hypothetical protein T492DRAFT_96695 [Pavlovales sp. CCMP2436]